MSERRPGVTRLRHGAGVRVGHVCAEGTVHGPIVSRQPPACFPDQNFWQKRTQKLWYTAGWESRSVGWVTGVDARATGTRRLRGDDARASMPPHAHRGVVPVFLMQLSSTDDCTCPRAPRGHAGQSIDRPFIVLTETKLSLTHGCVHRTERVQQQPSATIIRCVQWMQRSRNHSQSLWRPACRPYSTHNQKPWVQYCTHACFTNHGLCTGCNIAPRIKTMVCTRDANCTPVLQTMYNPKPWVPSSAGRVQETERMIHRPKAAVDASWMQAGCARGPHRDKLVRTTGASAPKQLPTSRA